MTLNLSPNRTACKLHLPVSTGVRLSRVGCTECQASRTEMKARCRAAIAFATALAPTTSFASLHVSGGGVYGLLLVGFAAFLAVPVLALVTARAGERARDFLAAVAIWLIINLSSCMVPTGEYGGTSDMIRFERFKYLCILGVVALCVFRGIQWVQRRRKRTP